MKNITSSFKRSFALCVMLLVAFISCNKNTPTPAVTLPYGTVQGAIHYVDYLTNVSSILDSQTVIIRYDSTDTSALYTVQTDASGYFSFLVDTTKRYIIYANPTVKSNPTFSTKYYFADTILKYSSDTLSITAYDSTKESGIKVHVTDLLGDAVTGAVVIFYSSPIIAKDDSLFTGVGSVGKLTTNGAGNVTIILPVGNVYINSELLIGSGNTLKKIGLPVSVTAKTIISVKDTIE